MLRASWLLILAFSASGQQLPVDAPASDPTIKLNVRQVIVPVVVTDKKGHPVSGLRTSDFRITEDGVEQEIVAFTREVAPSTPAAAAAPASTTAATGAPGPSNFPAAASGSPGETWVFCVDALHTDFASLVRAKTAIDKALDRGSSAGGQFVLLTIGRRLRVFQPATRDAALIRAKVNSKEFANLPAESDSPQITAAVSEIRKRMDLYCSGCPCGRDAGNRHDTCDVERQQIRHDLDARSEQFAAFDKEFLGELRSVVQELARLDGRRNLLFISTGFSLMPGRELFATAGAYLPNSPYLKFDPVHNLQGLLDQSLKIAAAQNIVVNTIDARGSYSPAARPGGLLDASNAAPGSTGRQEVLARRDTTNAMRGGSLLEETDSKWSSVEIDNGSVLSQLAKASGGVYFHDNNDLQKGLREALDDRRETYVIAYVSKNLAQDGKFRQIAVTLSSAHAKTGSVVLRAKSGYWAEGPTPGN